MKKSMDFDIALHKLNENGKFNLHEPHFLISGMTKK